MIKQKDWKRDASYVSTDVVIQNPFVFYYIQNSKGQQVIVINFGIKISQVLGTLFCDRMY